MAKDYRGKLSETKSARQQAAESYATATEEKVKSPRKMISFYVTPETYQTVQALAGYRAFKGIKNEKGQPFSAGALINESLEEYIARHQDDLRKWEEMQRLIAEEVAEATNTTPEEVVRAGLFAKGIDSLTKTSKNAADIILTGNSGLTNEEIATISKLSPKDRKEVAKAIEAGATETAKGIISKRKN